MASRPPATIWLARPSRFARISRRQAQFWLAGLVVLLLASASAVFTPGPPAASHDPASAASDRADVLLYQQIAAGVRGGGNYYAVAVQAQRQNGYPVRPFVTMRLPTLALIQARLPAAIVFGLICALAAATLFAWYLRLSEALARRTPRLIGLALLALGGMICIRPDLMAFHEVWAGLLVALSLAVWRPGDWVLAVGIAACAMLIRETAALYAMVMAMAAWMSGDRREAYGWAAALGLLALMVMAHAYGWSQVVRPDDPVGPGWSGMLGFGFFTKAITLLTALAILPELVGVTLVGLAIFGWASWRDPLAQRVLLVLAAYALLISLFCRADTYYWGLMVAPVTLIGLAFAPDGLRDLIGSLRPQRRIVVTRSALGDNRAGDGR
ncbi:MAG: hypothetical protein WC816_03635 [Sphingomonas sp.]